MWGRKGMSKIAGKGIGKVAGRLAENIDKESFLEQLKDAWYPHVKKNSDLDEEVKKARYRIDNSRGFKAAFDKVGVTDEELKDIIKEIQDSKPEQLVNTEPKVGRNEPCPCGSGKKYKKCCGNK